ncbi:hypothetical protein Tco_0109208 [Tanacetum coccineum]
MIRIYCCSMAESVPWRATRAPRRDLLPTIIEFAHDKEKLLELAIDTFNENLLRQCFIKKRLPKQLDDILRFYSHNHLSLKSIASILEGFINDPHFEENDDLFDLECKTNDEAECFDPGGENEEIDAFLAIEVPTYIEEGYYDSEGDVLYLESFLNDDTTHNISLDVFFDQ